MAHAPDQGTSNSTHGISADQVPRHTGSSMSRQTRKQPCIHGPEPQEIPKINHLARLPLEMLCEVLSWTTPPDILALARTSRHFCLILISEKKVWQDARKRFLPVAIPDPIANWTESAYAAFIFDPEPCEVCNRTSYRIPFSFSLRARLCDNYSCHNEWLRSLRYIRLDETGSQDLAHTAAVQSWLPYYEGTNHENNGAKGYRPLEWSLALAVQRRSTGSPDTYVTIQQGFARKASRLPQIMKHAKKLHEWADGFEKFKKMILSTNTLFFKQAALWEGFNVEDIINTSLFHRLQRKYIKMFQEIPEEAYFQHYRDQFRQEVAARGEARVRRVIDNKQRINRQEIRHYWNVLRTNSNGPLPPYTEFRKLSIIKTLERKNTLPVSEPAGPSLLHGPMEAPSSPLQTVRDELETSQEIQGHIREEIEHWLAAARKDLAAKLGDRYSLFTSTRGNIHTADRRNYIHTVDRVTAWFRCKRCNKVGRSSLETQALTFAKVFNHQCHGLKRKELHRNPWNLDFFEPDTKAVAAAKQLLRLCSLDERRATDEQLAAFGCRFRCKNCGDGIVMNASSVIGHSKRHDQMEIELLPRNRANAILTTPPRRGLVADLLGPSKGGESMRRKYFYACRHCTKPKQLTFDGLRSHLKSKHHIEHVRDEDVSRTKRKSSKKKKSPIAL